MTNIYLKLNNYDYSTTHLNNVKHYLLTNQLPSDLTPQQTKTFKMRYKPDLFEVKNNKLFYKPLNLECVENDNKENILKLLYDDFKIGTGTGIKSFYYKVIDKYLGIKRADVKDFIINQVPYQLRKQVDKPINKPIIAEYPNQRWAVDLIDLSYIRGYNSKKEYIMTVIDFFSKYVFAVALTNKKPESIIKAFTEIKTKQSQGIFPKYLQSDNGGEFKNEKFDNYCKENNIIQIFTKSYTPTTNGLIENFNKYLRKMIYEGFIRTDSLRWVDHLDDYLYNRNHSKHSTIKQFPVNVWVPNKDKIIFNKRKLPKSLNNNNIKQEVYNNLLDNAKRSINKYEDVKLNIGDNVRISTASIDSKVRKLIKNGEAKKIVVKWTPSIYKVTKIINPDSEFEKPQYRITRYNNRSFYSNELLKVNKDEINTISIDKLNKITINDDKNIDESNILIEKRKRKPKVIISV